MKFSEEELQQRTWEAFVNCTHGVPFLKEPPILLHFPPGEDTPQCSAKLISTEGEQRVLFEYRSIGQPKVARNAVNQILRHLARHPDYYGIFVAPYISTRSAEICSREGIGYLDFAGNCRLIFGGIYIEKKGAENPFSEKRELRSLYSPKASRILRIMTLDPKKVWKIELLAKEAEVSLGLVSKVKTLLGCREWITIERNGFRLTEPEALVQEWAKNYSFRKNDVANYYSFKGLPDIESQIADVLSRESVRYAFTGFSGAARFAPVVRYQRAMVFVEDFKKETASVLGIKPVNSGGNISVLTPYDRGVFFGIRELGGVIVTSPVQIYLDLVTYRGRGEEAAKEMLEQVIRPKW
jgi:hypothetical protein